VLGHEGTTSALGFGALSASTGDLSVVVNLVELQDGELDLLVLVVGLLGLGVSLLFSLLGSSSKTEHKVKGGLLLDVVVREGAAILQLLSGEDKSLLIGGDTLLVLDLGLNVIDGVRGLDLEGDGLSSQGLDEDLHASSKAKDQVEGRFLLNIVVRKSSTILKLLSSEDQSLLIGWDSFLVLDLGLDILNGV